MDSSSNKRPSGSRTKKRKGKFYGNQHRNPKSPRLEETASYKKIKLDASNSGSDFSGYVLIDIDIVLKELENCLSCKICHGTIKINCKQTFGLSSKFTVICSNCSNISAFQNSKMLGAKKNVSELNKRFIYAMRCIGQGHAGMKTFAAVMDLPSTVSQTSYNASVNKILYATSKVCEESKQEAVNEEIQLAGSSDITVSGDGTWKTRGHSSLVGVCTLIGSESGKVLDTNVMSSFCKGCLEWDDIRAGPAYETWLEEHKDKCVKNHIGSAGMMEVNGMVEMFKRSKEKFSTRYSTYIGDGDCKTFSAIQKSKPYEFSISKLECVGHVQKRMGSRLRKLKKDMHGKKLADGKSLGGKGRLTDAVINQLTSYYGNAIRKNADSSVRDMQSAVWAIWYHKASTNDNPMHHFCPKGGDSWCKYNKAIEKGCAPQYKHNSLPTIVMDSIKEIFKELSHPELLRKCLGGKTQNANESLNALIWKFCPKTSGASRRIVEIAVNEATVAFNDGWKGRLKTMNMLGLCPGINAEFAAVAADAKRISESQNRTEKNSLEARISKQQAKKEVEKNMKKREGKVYAAGGF